MGYNPRLADEELGGLGAGAEDVDAGGEGIH